MPKNKLNRQIKDINNRVNDFVNGVMQKKDSLDGGKAYYDGKIEELKAKYSVLEAEEIRVGANGTEEDFKRIRNEMRDNTDSQDFFKAKKACLVKSYEADKKALVAEFNSISNDVYVEALAKVLPLLNDIKKIVDAAEEQNDKLHSIREFITSGYNGIDVSTPAKVQVLNVSRDFNDQQLALIREVLAGN